MVGQVTAGVYTIMPLAWRSLKKIRKYRARRNESGRRAGNHHARAPAAGVVAKIRPGPNHGQNIIYA